MTRDEVIDLAVRRRTTPGERRFMLFHHGTAGDEVAHMAVRHIRAEYKRIAVEQRLHPISRIDYGQNPD